MNYADLGTRIRQERQRLNLTQERLAERVDLSHAYIGQIERGERSLSLETLVKLANELGATVDYLLSEAVEVKDEALINKIKQTIISRTLEEQQMALEMIELMFSHIDKLGSFKDKV
ncbi:MULTISPECIES: helix-turn-helix domain-containing protein [Paenibacillus]|uniref:helix-turn-helix domain-containing protein n=1 Tax=Paenibacillus TaxID=44249 RepID=UPI0030D166D1